MDIRSKLIHGLTQYDMRQSKRKGYNPYALAQYLTRIDEIMDDIAAGATPRAAIIAAFTDRLQDAALKAIGEPKGTDAECRGGNHWSYQPASRKDI
jgi:hypothetical protein